MVIVTVIRINWAYFVESDDFFDNAQVQERYTSQDMEFYDEVKDDEYFTSL